MQIHGHSANVTRDNKEAEWRTGEGLAQSERQSLYAGHEDI
jgi:hypothetical protein